MQDSTIALSPVLQFRQDLQATLHAGVRRAIEAVLEEELLAALGADAHERTTGRRGYRHGTVDRTVTTREGTRTLTVPRARLRDPAGPSTEFQSTVLPRYARRTREVDDALLGAISAGSIAAASAGRSSRSWERRRCRRAPSRAWWRG